MIFCEYYSIIDCIIIAKAPHLSLVARHEMSVTHSTIPKRLVQSDLPAFDRCHEIL